MLLAIDAGNTHTVIGLIKDKKVKHHWRLPTQQKTTLDQFYLLLKGLFEENSLKIDSIEGFCFCSVVPEISNSLEHLDKKLNVKTLDVDDVKERVINIKYDNPQIVGSDRIANAVAVKEEYEKPAIVVDFGTATTFDVVSSNGDYLGGAIAPGVETSINGLLEKAAQLHDVQLEKATSVIGRNTKESISAGFIIGIAGLTDSLIKRIQKETNQKHKVVSTGGFSELISQYCNNIDETDIFLTLKGLEIIYKRETDKQ